MSGRFHGEQIQQYKGHKKKWIKTNTNPTKKSPLPWRMNLHWNVEPRNLWMLKTPKLVAMWKESYEPANHRGCWSLSSPRAESLPWRNCWENYPVWQKSAHLKCNHKGWLLELIGQSESFPWIIQGSYNWRRHWILFILKTISGMLVQGNKSLIDLWNLSSYASQFRV